MTVKQRDKIGDVYSSYASVSSWVPQGSCTGPLLFILYANVRDGPKRGTRDEHDRMRLLTSFNLAQRQPYKHPQIQVYNRYYNSDYTPYYQYCILHIPTWGSISHVNGSHRYLGHITCHTSIDRNSYYK